MALEVGTAWAVATTTAPVALLRRLRHCGGGYSDRGGIWCPYFHALRSALVSPVRCLSFLHPSTSFPPHSPRHSSRGYEGSGNVVGGCCGMGRPGYGKRDCRASRAGGVAQRARRRRAGLALVLSYVCGAAGCAGVPGPARPGRVMRKSTSTTLSLVSTPRLRSLLPCTSARRLTEGGSARTVRGKSTTATRALGVGLSPHPEHGEAARDGWDMAPVRGVQHRLGLGLGALLAKAAQHSSV